MRPTIIVAALCAAVASSGCLVLSLQPAYDAESVAYDESLIGVWTNAEDQTQATIERGEWRSYKITFKDRFATRNVQANLTRVGAATYLDVTEPRGSDSGPLLVPVHGFVRVDVHGDTLSVAAFDYNWFARAVEQKTLERLTAALDDRRNVVVASPTADIRRWLANVPDEALAAPMTFTRAR